MSYDLEMVRRELADLLQNSRWPISKKLLEYLLANYGKHPGEFEVTVEEVLALGGEGMRNTDAVQAMRSLRSVTLDVERKPKGVGWEVVWGYLLTCKALEVDSDYLPTRWAVEFTKPIKAYCQQFDTLEV